MKPLVTDELDYNCVITDQAFLFSAVILGRAMAGEGIFGSSENYKKISLHARKPQLHTHSFPERDRIEQEVYGSAAQKMIRGTFVLTKFIIVNVTNFGRVICIFL